MIEAGGDLAVIVVVAVVANALGVYLVYRIVDGMGKSHEPSEADPVEPVTPHHGRITCPACGTVNEYGYRFCRSCVGDLPGGRQRGGGGAGHRGSGTN